MRLFHISFPKRVDEKQKLVEQQIYSIDYQYFSVPIHFLSTYLVHDRCTTTEGMKRFGERRYFFFHVHYIHIICTRHTHTKQNCAHSLGSLTVGLAFFPLFPINLKSIDFDSRFRDREFRFCKWSTVEQNRSARDLFLVDDPSLSPQIQEIRRLCTAEILTEKILSPLEKYPSNNILYYFVVHIILLW